MTLPYGNAGNRGHSDESFREWLGSDDATEKLRRLAQEPCDKCGEFFDKDDMVFWNDDNQHCKPCYDYLCAYSEYQAELAEEQRAEQAGAEK